MVRRSAIVGAVAALLAAPAAGQTSISQTSSGEFYKGRSIDLYIGFSAGGVYDITARLLSRFIGRHLPGNPTILPRNMTGAGSLRLVNWLYSQGAKDGTTIATVGRGAAFDALLGGQGVQFDANKLGWIGSTNDEVSICASWTATGVTTVDDLYKKELIVGSAGGSADDEQYPRVLNAVLDTRMRIVSGFPGGNEIKLAMQRGEVGGRCGWSWSSVKATESEWLKERKISSLVQFSFRKHPDLPDVPLVMDLARTDEERQIFKVMFARQVMAWPYVAPPGLPAERLAALRRAFDETMQDKDFLAEAGKLNLEVMPVSGARIQSLVEELYRTTSPATSARIATMLK